MRVFVTGLRGIPDIMGGVESHCEELYPRALSQSPRLDVTILARRPYVNRAPFDHDGLHVVPLPSTRNARLEAIVGTFFSVLHARRQRADLIHIHAVGPALLTPLARILGLRVVVTHHGEDYARAKWGRFARIMLRLGEKAALRFAQAIIVVAPSLRETLARENPAARDRLVYIPNGTSRLPEQGSAADEVLATAGFAPGDYFLTVGRLVPEKAVDQLIEAVRRVPGAKLLVVGGSDHESAFADRVRAMADADVVFAGVQTRATLRDLYQRCRLFVLPSLHEGLPIAALEAGSVGAPMLLSDIPANTDIGLPSHHYFRTGSIDDLVAKLAAPAETYAIDPAGLRLRFDWNGIAAQTLAVYDRVASGKAPRE